ncbi:MAG: hypothetical protein AAF351_03250 [Pseudomonadota bacterium]
MTTPRRVIVIILATTLVVTLGGYALFISQCDQCEPAVGDWLWLFFAGIAVLLAAAGFVLVATGIGRSVWCAIRMAFHVNDTFETASWAHRFNRLNLIYAPRYLNEQGLKYRRSVFTGLLTFFLGLALSLPIILVTHIFPS